MARAKKKSAVKIEVDAALKRNDAELSENRDGAPPRFHLVRGSPCMRLT